MDLLVNAEQEELVRVLGRLCLLGDPSAREQAARDVGLFEAEGLAPDDEAVAFRILGRHLAPVSWLATALAAPWRPPGMVALAEPHGPGTWRILGGPDTTAVLAVGRDEARLLALADRPGGEPGFDPGTDVAVVPEATIERAVGQSAPRPAPLESGAAVLRRGSLLVAALLAGSAEASLQRSVAHVAQREQFGRPIGTFQAVAHRCADMAVRAEAATAAVHLAAAAMVSGADDIDPAIAAARLVAADAALRNAAEDIQHHGALGFTADVDCHRHLKRAHLLERTLGGPAAQVAVLVSGSAAGTRPA